MNEIQGNFDLQFSFDPSKFLPAFPYGLYHLDFNTSQGTEDNQIGYTIAEFVVAARSNKKG